MLGLAAYGSDDSDSETTQRNMPETKPIPASSSSSLISKPLPRSRTKRTVFTVAKPSKQSHSDVDSDEAERPTKKAKLESRKGKGSSSLLAMLPAPSKKIPPPKSPTRGTYGTGVNLKFPSAEEVSENKESRDVDKSTFLLPPSLEKSKIKSNKGDHPIAAASEVDFFSLGNHDTPTSASSSKTAKPPSNAVFSSSVNISSAPTVAEFRPPSPTSLDPYPGYYQLPSGQWAAYDPDYYKQYWENWAAKASVDVMPQKGFEGAGGEGTVEVDAQAQLDLSEKEREERKLLTKNAAEERKEPRMNIKASNISSLARTRHQLSTLLTDAYANREALEEKIAQGRRNRKEAGNKYAF